MVQGGNPQVNKFEQVSSDHRQMSVAAGVGYPRDRVFYHVAYPMVHLTAYPPLWTDTCLWKHYLPQSSFAGGNNSHCSNISQLRNIKCWNNRYIQPLNAVYPALMCLSWIDVWHNLVTHSCTWLNCYGCSGHPPSNALPPKVQTKQKTSKTGDWCVKSTAA